MPDVPAQHRIGNKPFLSCIIPSITFIAGAYAHVVLKNLASFLIFVENDQNTSILTGVRTGAFSLLRLFE